MTERNWIYTINPPSNPRALVTLSPAEQRIIEWIRRESGNGRDWSGTIRYVSGAGLYQMADHVNAGQEKT